MPRRERGSVLVEAIVAVPACIVCALAIADGGALVRDRLAVTQAATRAARAQLTGGDVRGAARAALPARLRSSMHVRVARGVITVEATSRPTVLRVPGGVAQRSQVAIDAGGAR
ncbi:MAG: hypothetical protein JWN72_1121 [Thermoleophilia bacterium]|nr:hypothetical protein [Thermoleophilia bacterium]